MSNIADGQPKPNRLDATRSRGGAAAGTATRRRLTGRHPGRFVYRGVGPDSLDRLTGKLIELTTSGSKQRNGDKSGDYETCDYALYKLEEVVSSI
ncbi:hypothetical protein JOD64_005250 [Micromonospora luteifusca]|uniref:Uncharacterized protein n=1 Tax=Micromonospora luteifusca TaxID=709860 RepID=A0ABS2M0Q1_9ACTN|nr:hypothetical protein [Micromonospora luteifusca]